MARGKRFPVKDSDFVKASGSSQHGCDWCVEVARKKQGVAIRDSQNPGRGTLFFSNNEWAAFTKGVKNGEFDPVGRVSKRLR